MPQTLIICITVYMVMDIHFFVQINGLPQKVLLDVPYMAHLLPLRISNSLVCSHGVKSTLKYYYSSVEKAILAYGIC